MWTKLKSAIFAAAVLFGTIASAPATTITITPDKDNTLIQDTNAASQLSNGEGDIFVGRTNQDGQGPATVSIRRGLVHFNVAASIPSGATITAATLTMREVRGLNGDQTIDLERALQDWGQGSSSGQGSGAPAQNNDATWLYTFFDAANPSASPTWTTPGGSFSSVVSASTLVTAAGGPGQSFSWTGSQMIADVQSWINGPTGNFGWGILGNESMGQTAKEFNSSEMTTPPALPPMLTISYTVFAPGDVNHDGVVNGLDIALVSSHWLQTGAGAPGDANGDGVVNGLDIALISSHWLQTGPAGAAAGASVPEPSGCALLALGLASAIILARRRSRAT